MKLAFDTSTLEAAKKAKQERDEGLRLEVLRQLREILPEMAGRFGVTEVVVFGSVTRPRGFRVDSDVDVAVRGLDGRDYFKFAGELSLRLGREVDVVELERSRFAEKILRDGVKIGKRQ
ncbi:MAG: nucleotidyltransferase family protein [Promethearchaeota archaeon]